MKPFAQIWGLRFRCPGSSRVFRCVETPRGVRGRWAEQPAALSAANDSLNSGGFIVPRPQDRRTLRPSQIQSNSSASRVRSLHLTLDWIAKPRPVGAPAEANAGQRGPDGAKRGVRCHGNDAAMNHLERVQSFCWALPQEPPSISPPS